MFKRKIAMILDKIPGKNNWLSIFVTAENTLDLVQHTSNKKLRTWKKGTIN